MKNNLFQPDLKSNKKTRVVCGFKQLHQSVKPLPQHLFSCTHSLPRPIAPTQHQPAKAFCMALLTHTHTQTSTTLCFRTSYMDVNISTGLQTVTQTNTNISLAGKHTAQENTVSLVSCLNNHHLSMVDIALTSLPTEKPSLLRHLRSELGLFRSVRVPPFDMWHRLQRGSCTFPEKIPE